MDLPHLLVLLHIQVQVVAELVEPESTVAEHLTHRLYHHWLMVERHIYGLTHQHIMLVVVVV